MKFWSFLIFSTLMIAAALPLFADENSVEVQSNLFEVRAMLFDVAEKIGGTIPDQKADVVFVPSSTHEANDLLLEALTTVLTNAGHTVLLDESSSAGSQDDTEFIKPVGDYSIVFNLKEVGLAYPNAGRKFGLWRQWVDRDLFVSVHARVIDASSSVVLLDKLITNSKYDRIAANDFDTIESSAYSFTNGDVSESGMRRVFEQVVVISALSGMVAAYFANTGSQ
ncbi:hypothetical protein HN388_02560 [bacterium]|nr:hypothetical protein [bacterium]MBT7311697.1 hypothetical protein [bacterium]